MSTSKDKSKVNTGGGAYVNGNVSAGHNFVGRDQFNIEIILGKVDDTVSAVSAIVQLMRLRTKDDLVNAGIVAVLTELMVELRRTHSTIVKLISPFRRIEDIPNTFSRDFKAYYNDFRDFVDTHDFIDERTHCSNIALINNRLLKTKSRLAGTREWQTLQSQLYNLATMDEDVIEEQYVPFVGRLDAAMKSICDLVDLKQINDAIAKKRELLAVLEPEFEKTKAKLGKMNDTINTLVSQL